MHTSRPRRLRDKSGHEYAYLLHWGPQSFLALIITKFLGETSSTSVSSNFLDDLDTLLTAYLADLSNASHLQDESLSNMPKIEIQDFTI